MTSVEPATPSDRLDSWKEIAAYLGRTEKTAQRWEQSEGLPVHRLAHHERGSVYAYRSEIDAWRVARRVRPEAEAVPASAPSRAWWVGAAALLVAAGAVGVTLWPTATLPPRTLAVLPFSTQTDDGSNYLGIAIAETIADHLAGAADLRVRPFASSLRFSSRTDDPAAIGRAMGVGMVATGRVRSAGEGLDIKVELVDVASNAQTWGASYSSREPDLAATQETIALAVREQLLRHAFGPGFRPAPYQVSNPLSRNPLAVRAYLKANEFRRNPGRTQIRTGIERFKDAVALDPGFVRAYAGLGVSYVVITYFDELPATETIGQAKEYARKAVQLDPGQALGHQALAFVSHSFDYDQKEAEDHFHHAIATVQPAPGPLNWYADFLIEMDRFDEAEAMLRRAVEADPTWLQNDIVHANGLLFAGRTAEAIATYQSVLRADPNHGLARYFLGRAYLDAGRPAEAIAELRQAGAAMGDPPFARAGLANALAQSGSRGEATQMLADFMQRRHDAYYPAFAIAAVHAGLGDTAAALDWLERAANERLVGYYMPNVDKMWKPLRSQARFRALLDRLGVPLFPES